MAIDTLYENLWAPRYAFRFCYNFIFCLLLLWPSTCYAMASSHHKNKESLPFDAQQWRQVSLHSTDNTRYRMITDLFKQYPLIGMRKEQILELLGPQSDEEYFRDWHLRYWLGPEPGIGIDSIWLVMRCKDGVITEYRLLTD